jgi:hypothetical protein
LKCRVKFDDQELIIRRHSPVLGRVMAKGVREGGLYRLLADAMKKRALLINIDNLCELWHKIFDHLNYRSLLLLKIWWLDFLISRWRGKEYARMCTRQACQDRFPEQ